MLVFIASHSHSSQPSAHTLLHNTSPAAKSFFKPTQVVTMFSSPSQGSSPPFPSSSASSERPEIVIEEQHVLSQLEHTTPLARVSSKRKYLSRLFKRGPKVKKAIPNLAASSTSATLVGTDGCIQFAASTRNAVPVSSKLHSPLLAKVQEIPKLEYDLHALKLMRIADYKQAVYIDTMTKRSLQDTDDNLFPLKDKVKDFLASDTQVMLVLGDSEAGKSTFNRHLEHQLWQEYKSGGRIPPFVNLPSIERPEKDLIAEQLRIHKFSETQIRELEQHRQFVLICDGQLTSKLHTTNSFNRSGQREAKLLITCRSQYLGPDYRGLFVPQAVNKYSQAADELFMEAVIAPFSKEQIEDYVERYVPLEPRTWVKKDYMDKLEPISNLLDLVKNPFLLTLCLEALPDVVQGKSNLTRLRVTRVQLYNFVWHWLRVNKRRLQDKLRGDKLAVFEELLEAGFEQIGFKFQQDLATASFVHQDGRPIVNYINKHDKSSWKAAFFSSAFETSLLRDTSLLSRAGTQYRFVHHSILEYFFACTISGPIKNLVVEPSIIQVLAERAQLDSGFKDDLLAVIELSKTDVQAMRSAANAITILVKAGVRFSVADLPGNRVPGADISGGQFDSAQLQGADLTGVNLTKSWILQVNFTKAQMEGVQFGEMPYLKEDTSVVSCAYSLDGTLFAVGLHDGRINIYDTSTWTKTHNFQRHRSYVYSIPYSPTGYQLLSGSNDKTAR
ncbi:hypothetical protein K457DRAFT_1899081 [Linnemannia elongata AG-77]|uniref:Anaphase-promoting complex subunit 4-like WD40 domain-containing protein n=1 Tax=Linnemannia elongata AG-77 TaxID=1314771 RepID=A0A197JJX0_9FUNG|nr:hypothetical protein K457DRAFT_1899081 [Linnemannia elongata AG-77]